MKNIFKILPILVLAACEIVVPETETRQVDAQKQIEAQPEAEVEAEVVAEYECVVPGFMNFDDREIASVETGERVILFSFQGLATMEEFLENAAMAFPHASFPNPETFACSMDGQGPYNCAGGHILQLQFPTQEEITTFAEQCIVRAE